MEIKSSFLDIFSQMWYNTIKFKVKGGKNLDTLRPVDRHMKINLNEHLDKLEDILNADVLTIFGPMRTGLDKIVKGAVELFQDKRTTIAVILDTLGGTAEVVERMVDVIRHHYDEVDFLIPDRAMSAGTIFTMAGDRIFMGYFSGLGPIDPQVEKDGRLFPALGYLTQYERLCKKSRESRVEHGRIDTS